MLLQMTASTGKHVGYPATIACSLTAGRSSRTVLGIHVRYTWSRINVGCYMILDALLFSTIWNGFIKNGAWGPIFIGYWGLDVRSLGTTLSTVIVAVVVYCLPFPTIPGSMVTPP